ncbi:hypothetical protein PAXRUDRAFT_32798 [Paxillus rubicundulus Ve08.2h10]|uniref:Uncharacterized protein n=1 Tax=Paxillus rubicundulus Ve08.2h10 TaxID=930991 RepID=A0A0D0DRM3_9AGAM|nr:hypothetical protein PAXRUDRAFT_32798 [Paxillus rubicundulus Ve08.2h10]
MLFHIALCLLIDNLGKSDPDSGNGNPTLGLAYNQPKDLPHSADARTLPPAGSDHPFLLTDSDIIASGRYHSAPKIRPQPEGDVALSPAHMQSSGQRKHTHGIVAKIASVISRWFRLFTEACSVAVICAVRMRLAGYYTLPSLSYVTFILIGHLW